MEHPTEFALYTYIGTSVCGVAPMHMANGIRNRMGGSLALVEGAAGVKGRAEHRTEAGLSRTAMLGTRQVIVDLQLQLGSAIKEVLGEEDL